MGGTDLSSLAIEYRGGLFSHGDSVMPAGYAYPRSGLPIPAGSLLGARSEVVTPPDGLIHYAKGVQIRCDDYETWRTRFYGHIPCTKQQEKAYYQFLLSQVGKPYDSLGIWYFITGRIPSDRDWRDPSAWFCDELILAALEIAQVIRPFKYIPIRHVDPGGAFDSAWQAGLQINHSRSYGLPAV